MKLFRDWGVRATFGLFIIGGYLFATFYALIYKPNLLGIIKDMFEPIVIAVVSFYFGQRSVKKEG